MSNSKLHLLLGSLASLEIVMKETAHEMREVGAEYPEVRMHGNELGDAAEMVGAWVDGIRSSMKKRDIGDEM